MPGERIIGGPRIALPSIEKAKAFIARHLNPDEAVRVLLRDLKEGREKLARAATADDASHELRGTIRELEAELEQVSGKIPGAEQVVLAKADATELEEYRKLGKVADVTAALKTAGELSGKVTEADREKSAAKAAKALGYNAEAMLTLARDLALDFTFKKETINKKEVEVPYVKRASDAKEVEPVKLSEFAKKNPIYLLALKQKGKGESGDGTGNDFINTNGGDSSESGDEDDESDDEDASGTMFAVTTTENGKGKNRGGSTVDNFIKKRDEANAKRHNPLRPASSKQS